MIDQIRFDRRTNENGREYERVRMWIGGIPFAADNSAHVERVVMRFSSDHGIEVIDLRGREDA